MLASYLEKLSKFDWSFHKIKIRLDTIFWFFHFIFILKKGFLDNIKESEILPDEAVQDKLNDFFEILKGFSLKELSKDKTNEEVRKIFPKAFEGKF